MPSRVKPTVVNGKAASVTSAPSWTLGRTCRIWSIRRRGAPGASAAAAGAAKSLAGAGWLDPPKKMAEVSASGSATRCARDQPRPVRMAPTDNAASIHFGPLAMVVRSPTVSPAGNTTSRTVSVKGSINSTTGLPSRHPVRAAAEAAMPGSATEKVDSMAGATGDSRMTRTPVRDHMVIVGYGPEASATLRPRGSKSGSGLSCTC